MSGVGMRKRKGRNYIAVISKKVIKMEEFSIQ